VCRQFSAVVIFAYIRNFLFFACSFKDASVGIVIIAIIIIIIVIINGAAYSRHQWTDP